MFKKIEIFVVSFLIVFIFFCAINIGHSWDLEMEINRGNERLKCVFFLSSIENYIASSRNIGDEFYPAFYTTLVSFFSKLMPKKYEFETWQSINSLIGVFTVFGIYRITKILFNKQVGKIVFILCILNPIFFGHIAMNPKDIPIAFANIWTTYVFLRYLQKQDIKVKTKKYICYAGLLIGLGTGMRIPFVITLVPVLLFTLFDILYLKRIVGVKFSLIKFLKHSIVVLVIAYVITISCWPHVHTNILIEPFRISSEINKFPLFGLPWIFLNGIFFSSDNLPILYIFTNLFYKSPEFVLLCYLFSIYLLIFKKDFYLSKFNFLIPKILLLLFILIFPTVIYFIFPYKVYDGLRLFLYLIPYFCIFPALAIYYLISNFRFLISKILLGIISVMFIFYIYIFLILTPYQYTYLNLFAGNFSNAYMKFENDYWAVSIKELIHKISKEKNLIDKNKKLKLTYCGIPNSLAKKELKKIKAIDFEIYNLNDGMADYILMTNRVYDNKSGKLSTCFDYFAGKDIVSIKRNGLILSTLRKIKNN